MLAFLYSKRGFSFFPSAMVKAAANVFTVTPLFLLLMGGGINDMLRSFMAGSRHPPTSLNEPDSCVALDAMWQKANRSRMRRDAASLRFIHIACQQAENAAFPPPCIQVSSILLAASERSILSQSASTSNIVSERKWALTRMINFSLTFRKLNETLI